MPDLLDTTSLETAMKKIPGWELQDKEINRTFEFPAYLDGISFVDQIAKLAEDADHHPDIDIRWR
ncbi:MAG: 4a-hydroxytetrahydrobiopterin dehydratase, partial [Verrucomicrobiota bacterium]